MLIIASLLSLLLCSRAVEAIPFGSPNLPSNIPQSLYQELQVYAQLSQLTYCAASYPTSFPAFADFTCKACQANTIPSIANRTVVHTPDLNYEGFVATDSVSQTIYIGFRGSADPENLLRSAEFLLTPLPNEYDPEVYVLYGFITTFVSFADKIRAAIKEAVSANPTFKIELFGHSLGCALAQLTAIDMTTILNIPTTNMRLTGFGCPRVGNLAFAHLLDQTLKIPFRRIVHSRDIVTHYPPRPFGYNHAGSEYWINVGEQKFVQCVDWEAETNESPSCVNSVAFALLEIDSHLSYFDCVGACAVNDHSKCTFLPPYIVTKH